jgi:hypothetical protein
MAVGRCAGEATDGPLGEQSDLARMFDHLWYA